MSRLDGNQLQTGQSLIARGYITGNLIRIKKKREKKNESDGKLVVFVTGNF